MPAAEPNFTRAANAGDTVDAATAKAYWSKTSGLMWTMLIIWAIAGFGIHFFVEYLNQYKFLGFPLGFYMAAQGSLIVFVVMLFWFAHRQNAIDDEFGVAED